MKERDMGNTGSTAFITGSRAINELAPPTPRIDIDVLTDDEATVAEVKVHLGERTYTATRSAKKHPKDRFDRRIGESLAIARALWDLGDELTQEAQARIDTANYRVFRDYTDPAYEHLLTFADAHDIPVVE